MKRVVYLFALAALGGCASTSTKDAAHCQHETMPASPMADCTCNPGGTESVGNAVVGKKSELPSLALPGTAGAPVDLARVVAAAPLTVITFFSSTCPCQHAHDERLARYGQEFAGRGVAFYAIDSEAGSSLDADVKEAAARSFQFPILSDPEGKLADAVGARYATETFILDRQSTVRFRGGIDSDQTKMHEDAKLWLRDAIAALLDGREPPSANPKSFGCSLRRR